MDEIEILGLALNSLQHRQVRSYLAALGIVIGVASIIAFISISVGVDESIRQNLSSLGSNIITISPGGAQAQRFGGGGGFVSSFQQGGSNPLTFREADSLRTISGVSVLDARISGNGAVSYRNKNASMSITGTEPAAFPKTAGVQLKEGRWLKAGDTYSVVVGYSVAYETFNDTLLDKQIKIRGTAFRVVGILNQSGASFNSADNSVYIPQKTAKTLFNKTSDADSIYVVVADGYDTDEVAAKITAELQRLHRVTVDSQDFRVSTASQTQAAVSQIAGTLAIFLGAISSISLIVGGIGVANAMFTSVLEQTRFIGILRSLGAKKGDVMKLFLYESCLLGMVGGLAGVLLSFLGSIVIAGFGLPSKITLELVLLGVLFSTLAGAVSGIIPARNAAAVQPVDALRYE